MKRTTISSLLVAPALLFAALVAPATVAAADPCASITGANVTFDLWAKSGTLTLAAGTDVTIWGYSQSSVADPTVPGPQLVVNQCDHVTVNLTNTLGQATAIVFGGQPMVPDQTGAGPSGGTHTYAFTPPQPGTYLYEAGLIPGSQYQSAMGLHGALIVRPAGAPSQAYAGAATTFDNEAVVVLEDIDPTLNNSSTPWTVDLRAYNPTWFLVNGRPYSSTAPSIPTTAGSRLLLREVNAGIRHHSLATLGVRQSILSADGSELASPRSVVAETLAPGQTADVLLAIPATAAASTKYALYDGALTLSNGSANGVGGMLAYIEASGTAGGDAVGPATSGVTLTETTPNSGLYTVTASVSDVATGGAVIQAAEARADAAPVGPFAMSATDSAFDTSTESVTSTAGQIDTTTWLPGNHTVFVRGRDANGNWGPYASATIAIDRVGPTISGLTLTPNPSNGSVAVVLGGSASDATSGNANVVAAEYFLDAAGPFPMSLNKTAPNVSLSATIPAPLTSAVVSLHAKDAADNWGPYATINLTVDNSGPTTSGVTANPSANNGTYGQPGGSASVRITAAVSDTTSGGARIAAAEGFIDATGSNGAGFAFVAADGSFNSSTETVIADIPLSTINALTTGLHHIYVHGKDGVGNWGSTFDLAYVIDRTRPTFTSISLAPNPTNGSATVTLTVNGAADQPTGGPASGVAGGEYWIGTTIPSAGNGTKFSGLTATIPVDTLVAGSYTIGARVRDAAGSWSTETRTATVAVVPGPVWSNGFETGAVASTWGWTSRSTTNAGRLTVTTTSPMIGSRMLRAQGNNGNYVQYNFGGLPTAVYDARFYFNPNGNTSSGQDILAAASANNFNTQRFHVRYRMDAGQSQVQIQVGNTANTVWANLTNNAVNRIEVVWQAGVSLQLFVNGSLADTRTGTSGSIGAVRLGSVTSGGSNILEFFDGFTSKATASPLIGTGP